ncbi:MAG: class I SAM-dependent methyltransferase [Gemmatimonadota bacterium]|nr:class I SAM-dependent methyltransferase [Gemmatimonadota bacterium]
MAWEPVTYIRIVVIGFVLLLCNLHLYTRYRHRKLYEKSRSIMLAIDKHRIKSNEEETAERLEKRISRWRHSAQRAHNRRYHKIADIVARGLERRTENTKHLLDIGCGDGFLFTHLEGRTHGVDLYGMDLSHRRLTITKNRGFPVRVLDGNAENIPFSDDTFDIVICTEALEHLIAPPVALHEIKRILKPGGLMILTVPSLHIAFLTLNPLSWIEAAVSIVLPSVLPPFHDLYDPSDTQTVIHRAFSYQEMRHHLDGAFTDVFMSSMYSHVEGILQLPSNLSFLEMLWQKIPVFNKLGRIILIVSRKQDSEQSEI